MKGFSCDRDVWNQIWQSPVFTLAFPKLESTSPCAKSSDIFYQTLEKSSFTGFKILDLKGSTWKIKKG